MRKGLKIGKYLLIFILILLIPSVFAETEECQRTQDPRDVPCIITSAYNYTPPCSSHVATVFLENGTFIQNHTYQDAGDSLLCQFQWNISTGGSYIFTVDTGDTGSITITKGRGADDSMIATIFGFIITIIFFIFISWISDHVGMRITSMFFATIQLIFMMGVLYVNEAGGALSNLLRVNFYIFSIVGLGMAILTMYNISTRIVNVGDNMEPGSFNQNRFKKT